MKALILIAAALTAWIAVAILAYGVYLLFITI